MFKGEFKRTETFIDINEQMDTILSFSQGCGGWGEKGGGRSTLNNLFARLQTRFILYLVVNVNFQSCEIAPMESGSGSVESVLQ